MSWKKILTMVGVGILVFVSIKYLLAPVIPFLLGWSLACWILPAAKWFEQKLHIRRGIAGGILVGVSTVGIGWILLYLANLLLKQLSLFVERLSEFVDGKNQIYRQCCQMIERYTGISQAQAYQFIIVQEEKLGENIQNTISMEGMGYLMDMVQNGLLVISSILVVFIFAVLLIKDMETMQEKIQEMPVARVIWRVGKNIWKAGGHYIKAQGEIMLVVALVCVLGFWILGNRYFLLCGIVVGILDALPVLGAGMILIPWAILWILQGNYWMALGYLGLFFVADLVRQVLEPKILGKEIGIHPALMLISVYTGFWVYGVAGFLLGPITVLILMNLWKEINEKNPQC